MKTTTTGKKSRNNAATGPWQPSIGQIFIGIAVLIGIGLLYTVYSVSADAKKDAADTGASGYEYAVGDPGIGQKAPGFTLPGTNGDDVSLADYEGENVLLYFHEGGGCQPCWDQIADIEKEWDKFSDSGIDRFLAVTTDPIDIHTRKMADDELDSTGVSDPDLAVSERYDTNSYGMMRGTTNGHSFILVDGEGTITWRADYGGEPDYTMYVPVDGILADLASSRGE
ncbi:peroxiredoxin family protein [Haloglycomyces albus]|uniref:peroxiredoxin family protein n=1 Tax=Haloglycomyces albus TaxID=526067 RepID=UPI00046D7CBD|nr:peroxiredoxin family protein [Haloglycomyces albus]